MSWRIEISWPHFSYKIKYPEIKNIEIQKIFVIQKSVKPTQKLGRKIEMKIFGKKSIYVTSGFGKRDCIVIEKLDGSKIVFTPTDPKKFLSIVRDYYYLG